MREYCIGAFLLDRDDPTNVIGRLPELLIKPNTNERDGYVPNVVYSCVASCTAVNSSFPTGYPTTPSDYATTFATLPLEQVLAAMEWPRQRFENGTAQQTAISALPTAEPAFPVAHFMSWECR
jgi:predicted GH43/DUF377 family glycosyl hydrolase